MTHEEFTKILDARKYAYTLKDGSLVVSHQGYVYLRSLTTLPEGVKFNNKGSVYLESLTTLPEGVKFNNKGSVYLEGLTTLPEGVKFNNKGPVYLESLTTLPEGVKFNNKGSVYLESLTTLPECVQFNNQGYVYLESLTTLPEGVKFNNKGSVYLESLTTLPECVQFNNQGYVYLESLNKSQTYKGKQVTFKHVDGYTMLMGAWKTHSGYSVCSARYFGGGEVSKLKKCYVTTADNRTAHGATIKAAIDDLQYKIADNADKSQLAADVRKSGRVTLAQFRGLTGACREGIREHLSSRGIVLDDLADMPLADALNAMAGTSYGSEFSKHIEAAQ